MLEYKNNPKISVIIPTYNQAQNLLPRAIKSVLNQTFNDFELIIVDDSSTDNTEEVVKKFKKREKRIKYFKHLINSGGPSEGRNTGIKNSKGKYIAFLDADDEWLPEKLEKQLELFEQSKNPKLGFVGCNLLIIDEIQNKILEYKMSRHKNIFKALLVKDCIGVPSNMLILKNVFEKIGLFNVDLIVTQDWEMWLRIAQKYDFDLVNKSLTKYYYHSQSLSHTLAFKGPEEFQYIFEKYKKYYEKNSKLYSNFLNSQGLWYISKKELKKGGRSILHALKVDPFNIKSYLYYLISLLGYNFFYKLLQLKIILNKIWSKKLLTNLWKQVKSKFYI